MNIIGITGNLTRDVELRYTESGKPVASFCVAVKRPHTSDKSDFIDCVAWGQKAEFVSKWFSKGSGIAINGYLTTRMYEDREGNKRKAVELVCEEIGFMGGKKNSNESHGETYGSKPTGAFEELDEDDGDLPF